MRGGRRAPSGVIVVAVLAMMVAGCHSTGAKATGTTLSTTATTQAPTTATTAAVATTTSTASSSLTRTVTAGAGGLTISLAVTPVKAKAKSTISFKLMGHEGEAHGALEYQIFYGDGKTDQNPAPQYCVTAASVAEQSWALTHQYAAPGTYTAVLTVWANCTRDRAKTQPVTVTVS